MSAKKEPTVLILTDHHVDIYNWRRELIERLIGKGYRVILALPYGEKVDLLVQMGCEFHDVKINRRGKNPVQDLLLTRRFLSIIGRTRPGVVLTYGTKPNIYGGLACRIKRVPYIENLNGLGSGIREDKEVVERLVEFLYKVALKKARCVFFQNASDQAYCTEHAIVSTRNVLIPGSGVNLSYYQPLAFVKEWPVVFMYIARIMKEKGIDEYLTAARCLKQKYGDRVRFHVLGFCEEDYEAELKDLHDAGVIVYDGMQSDIRPFLAQAHCVVMPSYYGEGMSNTLLESAASARPVITTDLPGCGETVSDGVSGMVVKAKDAEDLIAVMEKFLAISFDEMEEMGRNGRRKMEQSFDRNIVVDAYLEQIGME